uniref:Arb2 domain-containing protein n=1 Tax=Timema tahoe TaxID=61484 RepID=A0A7R9FGQ1_9NEOP|nr:unnamed protein product [Timema tahoe]
MKTSLFSVFKYYNLGIHCYFSDFSKFFVMSLKKHEEIFPKTLKEFGYGFNEDGKLRKLDPATGEPGEEPFQFVVKDDQDYNQRHYEALGEVGKLMLLSS